MIRNLEQQYLSQNDYALIRLLFNQDVQVAAPAGNKAAVTMQQPYFFVVEEEKIWGYIRKEDSLDSKMKALELSEKDARRSLLLNKFNAFILDNALLHKAVWA